jgi:hypothetical protein
MTARRFFVLLTNLPDNAAFWRQFKAAEAERLEHQEQEQSLREEQRQRVGLPAKRVPFRHESMKRYGYGLSK